MIALLIAAPLAWYACRQWLQHFPFRISLSWQIWLAGVLAGMAIALLAISLQTVRTAFANPVNSLRTRA